MTESNNPKALENKAVKKSEMKIIDKGTEGPRVLTVVDSSQTSQDKDMKKRPGVIFKSGLQAKIKLEFFTTKFSIDGISLYDEGRNTLISSSMYNQIKTLLQLERSQAIEDQPRGDSPPAETELTKNSVLRASNNVEISQILISILMLLMI